MLVDKLLTRVGFVETGREDGGGKTKQGLPIGKTFYQSGNRLESYIWASYGCAHGRGVYHQHLLIQRQL